jgi:hypothetical protein
MKLASREFSDADQKQFAAVSGDHNPMHLDALQARRTPAGEPVVHGINLLLWTLDSLAIANPELPPLRCLRVRFSKFVYLGERVDVVLTELTPAGARLNISVGEAPRAKVSLDFGDAIEDRPPWSNAIQESIPFSPTPSNLSFEQASGRSGRISFAMHSQDAATLFPAATQWLGAPRIQAMAASTHLVGMVCPGLNSIYGELSVTSLRQSSLQDSLAFRVTGTDPRFQAVDQEICGGGLTGTVKSFFRTPPVQQASMQSLHGVVGSADFAGSVALIIGGSRGLGELTAKLIATGGGRVIVTWQTGQLDAEKVAQEIRLAGGSCETLAYDSRRPAADQLSRLTETPSHAYYFATPAIARPSSGIFATERLSEFLAVYVDGFWDLSRALRTHQPGLSLFYPSSVFVAERPKGMTEYAMAKAAGEVLCADMNASLSPAHITVRRLPRLPTDQTSSLIAAHTADPLETLLPVIREVQSWPR